MKRKAPEIAAAGRKRQRQHRVPKPDQAINQAKKRLFRALKTARGFERQKLGRRSKLAHQERPAADVARIEAEIAALKTLRLDSLAETHLYKSLVRNSYIADSPDLPQYVHSSLKTPSQALDKAHANVNARLLNTKPVKLELEKATQQISRTLGIETTNQVREKVKQQKEATSPSHSYQEEPKRPDIEEELTRTHSEDSPAKASDDRGRSLTTNDHVAGYGYGDSRESSEEPTSTSHISASSDAAGDSVSHSVQHLAPSSSTSPLFPAARQRAVTTTTFLPSLATGYISGSESDASVDAVSLPPKRNRMGQRARQALWERKYGTEANHVLKQTKRRDYGWDAKRGAQETSGSTRKMRGGAKSMAYGGKGRKPESQERNQDESKRDLHGDILVKKSEEPLHPSWEAKKRMKEQENQKVAFQGKKLVFD